MRDAARSGALVCCLRFLEGYGNFPQMKPHQLNTLARLAAITVAALAFSSSIEAAGVVRHSLPWGWKFPIARAVEVPAGFTLIFHSGSTPSPANPNAAPGSAAYWGNTETQTQ